jgi:chorismate mutase/prephenate dehydratase
MAQQLYGLQSFAKNIEDMPDNSTRFLIIGSEETEASGDDKTSIIVSTKNEPGALHSLLKPFHENGVDLTRVETRPSRSGTWNYLFFIDFAGHHSDDIVKKTLEEINSSVSSLKVLGSYPRGVL